MEKMIFEKGKIMMDFQFAKATKEKSKLRAAIFGPSGAGKTWTALSLSAGFNEQIALIDTERGSASKYGDRFDFDVLNLDKRDIETYVNAINAAAKAGYGVLIIDSLTHAWKELLEQVDKIAKTKYRGNTWSAWSEGNPKQLKLVDAILDYPGHIIATMRSKTEWSVEQTERGKTKPVRVGLAPEQGKGIEYEFDLLIELSIDHIATIIKDRSGRFQDRIVEKPGMQLGQEILAWLNDNDVSDAQSKVKEPQKTEEKEQTPKKLPRPLSATDLKEIAQVKSAKNTGKPSDKKRTYALSSLSSACDDNDDIRHFVSKFLFGVESSSDWTAGNAQFLIDWAGANEDNNYTPLKEAFAEVAEIIALMPQNEEIPFNGEPYPQEDNGEGAGLRPEDVPF